MMSLARFGATCEIYANAAEVSSSVAIPNNLRQAQATNSRRISTTLHERPTPHSQVT
jgi:hypothetical protein